MRNQKGKSQAPRLTAAKRTAAERRAALYDSERVRLHPFILMLTFVTVCTAAICVAICLTATGEDAAFKLCVGVGFGIAFSVPWAVWLCDAVLTNKALYKKIHEDATRPATVRKQAEGNDAKKN